MLNSPAPAGADRREVHLLDYWRILWRGRWTIASVFVVVTTLVALGTFTQRPIYRGMASVEIQLQTRKVAPVAEVSEMGAGGYGWLAEERYFNTQYEIIRSRAVASRVFERLDLYNHPSFQKASDPIQAFRSMVHIDPVKDTGIVEISLEGTNPEEVAIWTNTVAEAYVDRNLELAVQAASTAVQSLLKEVEPLRTRLQQAGVRSRPGMPDQRRACLFRHGDMNRNRAALAANRQMSGRSREDDGSRHARKPRQDLLVGGGGGYGQQRHVADGRSEAAQAAERRDRSYRKAGALGIAHDR